MRAKLIDIDLSMNGKTYLGIREVADKFMVTPDLLRKWEQWFPKVLKPKRTPGETRLYDEQAVRGAATIYRLLRQEGLSVRGAQARLANGDIDSEDVRQQVIARLQHLRQHLQEILNEIDNKQQ